MRTHSISLLILRSCVLFLFILKGFSVFGNCPPYYIPDIPTADDYANIVYIDPTAPNGGNGTIASPYNSINGLRVNNALPGNTAFLIKRGTQLNERVYAIINNSYIGAYGEGEKPILYGGVRIRSGSQYVTINDLNIQTVCPGSGGHSAIVLGEDSDVSHITIANSYLTGIYDPTKTFKYPYRAIKGKNNNWTIYNNIMSYVYDDAIGMGSGNNLTIVRNYVHHMDMKRVGNQYTNTQPGALTDGSEYNYDCGDGIHLNFHNDVYIAGNLIDRSNTSWKFALIYKTLFDAPSHKGAIVEYNTFIGNNGGPGGGTVIYLKGPRESTFRKNVIDGTNYGQQIGPSLFYDENSNGAVAIQSYPYGIYDNHLIRGSNQRTFYNRAVALPLIEENNECFTGYSEYEIYLNNNPDIGLYGSDIDPDNFWVSFNCDGNTYNVDFEILNMEGLPIDNANITFAGITNPQGNYSFSNIEEGTYSYSIQAQGFQTLIQDGFEVTSDLEEIVNLEPSIHQVSIVSAPVGSGITTGAGSYSYGQTANVTASAKEGNTFINWTENGSVVSSNANYSFTVTQNRNLTANFSAESYTIAVNASPTAGGTTAGAGNYSNGQSATVSATPATGYTFINWTEDGNVVSNNTSYTFTVSQNRNLTANFSINAYTIALNANPSNGGSISGGGTFNHGQSVSVTASAATGFTFINWTENGAVVSNSASYTFNATQNRNLTANFTGQSYTVALNVGPAGGGTTAGGGSFSHGQSVTVNAIPDQGYVFNSWIEDGIIVSSQATYTFTITQNRVLTATFEQEMFALTYLTDSNGEIVGNSEQVIVYGENGDPVHAVPLEGHHFVRWCDQLSFNPRTELFVTQNITRMAIFAKNVYHLSYGANENGIILGETDQFIEFGDNALPVEALPLSGYRFIGWSDGTYDNPRTDLGVNSDLQVLAIFDIEMDVEEPSINNILVYPIPARNVLNVEIPFAGEYEVHLFDMQGRHINTLPNATQGSQNYNISWLSPGVYYLNFVSPTGMLTKRIVKGR